MEFVGDRWEPAPRLHRSNRGVALPETVDAPGLKEAVDRCTNLLRLDQGAGLLECFGSDIAEFSAFFLNTVLSVHLPAHPVPLRRRAPFRGKHRKCDRHFKIVESLAAKRPAEPGNSRLGNATIGSQFGDRHTLNLLFGLEDVISDLVFRSCKKMIVLDDSIQDVIHIVSAFRNGANCHDYFSII